MSEAGTLVDLFLDAMERHRRSDALIHRLPDGSWEHLSHQEVGDRVRALALGLRSLGYQRGDRVGIIAPTRLEWALTDWAMIMAGIVPVPVYPQLPAEQAAYILANAGAVAVFASDTEQLSKVARMRNRLPEVGRAFLFDPGAVPDGAPETRTLEELAARGREAEAELASDYEAYARRTQPEDLATLIYTSGTTGEPKGVMLTHANLFSNVVLTSRRFPVEPGDRSLSILPLSHSFERTAGHFIMWYNGISVAYAESTETVARDMAAVRPTIMTAVPRVYEKVFERTQAAAREGGAVKERIFDWARSVGERRADLLLSGRKAGPWLSVRYALADRLVFSKLRERTGGRIRLFISGGAPLSPSIGRFFFAAGMPIIEGYGLTETSPVLCFNPHDRVRLGTVGPPIPETEIRIAEDGEILARGPQIMKGYYGNEEATREVVDADGWFHTGDIGTLDEDGYLSITDRKKEILVNAYGKNIAPAPVEKAILQSEFVSQALLVGDQRKFVVAIVVPDFDRLQAWAREAGLSTDGDPDTLLDRDEVRGKLEQEVRSHTAELARFERPRRILPVAREFTVEGGELTPTMKVKRRVVLERYGDRIERLYREAELERENDGPHA